MISAALRERCSSFTIFIKLLYFDKFSSTNSPHRIINSKRTKQLSKLDNLKPPPQPKCITNTQIHISSLAAASYKISLCYFIVQPIFAIISYGLFSLGAMTWTVYRNLGGGANKVQMCVWLYYCNWVRNGGVGGGGSSLIGTKLRCLPQGSGNAPRPNCSRLMSR